MTNTIRRINRRRHAGHCTLALLVSFPLAMLAGVFIGQAIASDTYAIEQTLLGDTYVVDHGLSGEDCAAEIWRYPGGACVRTN